MVLLFYAHHQCTTPHRQAVTIQATRGTRGLYSQERTLSEMADLTNGNHTPLRTKKNVADIGGNRMLITISIV